jgi:hypothetical protein
VASWDANFFFKALFFKVLRGVGLATDLPRSKVTDFLADGTVVLPSVYRARATGGLSPPLKNVVQINLKWKLTVSQLPPLQYRQIPLSPPRHHWRGARVWSILCEVRSSQTACYHCGSCPEWWSCNVLSPRARYCTFCRVIVDHLPCCSCCLGSCPWAGPASWRGLALEYAGLAFQRPGIITVEANSLHLLFTSIGAGCQVLQGGCSEISVLPLGVCLDSLTQYC